jgi:diguanylate cyclase (GGDEF)-like protein
MTSATANFFETLYHLLRGSRPNLGKVLALVEEQLQKSVCTSEAAAAQEQLLKFLTSFKQFFSKNKKSQDQVAELIRVIETEGMLELSAFAETLRAVMPSTIAFSPIHRLGNEHIPASFMGRVRQIFPTLESEGSTTDFSNQVLTEFSQDGTDIARESVESEKGWQEQLLLMGRGLIDAYPSGHLVDVKTTQFFQGNPVDGTRRGSQKIETMVRQQLLAYHRVSGSLGSKMEEGREKALKLKKRVDQLDEAVTFSQKSLFIDPGTAIPSRASFTAHLHRHLERAMHLGELFSLALVHIQDFSGVLSELDMEEENQFVKTIASLIRSEIHEGDFLARLGVDRFALIFPIATHAHSSEVANNIGSVLNSTEYKLSKGLRTLSARVGALSFEAGMTAHDMLTLTDNLADSSVEPKVFASSRTVLNVREA